MVPLLGRLTYGSRGRVKQELLYGLPVVAVRADPSGWLGEYRLKQAGRALGRWGALRTLAPGDFEHWELLGRYGLSPVDPTPLVQAQAAPLALEALERRGVAPDRATVALLGLRADGAMARAAAELCPQVRRLVISAPVGGRELAEWLRREFGVPVLPPEERGEAALRFHRAEAGEEERALTLYGPKPDLGGLVLCAPALAEEDSTDLPLLTALWEGGRLTKGAIKIT